MRGEDEGEHPVSGRDAVGVAESADWRRISDRADAADEADAYLWRVECPWPIVDQSLSFLSHLGSARDGATTLFASSTPTASGPKKTSLRHHTWLPTSALEPTSKSAAAG